MRLESAFDEVSKLNGFVNSQKFQAAPVPRTLAMCYCPTFYINHKARRLCWVTVIFTTSNAFCALIQVKPAFLIPLGRVWLSRVSALDSWCGDFKSSCCLVYVKKHLEPRGKYAFLNIDDITKIRVKAEQTTCMVLWYLSRHCAGPPQSGQIMWCKRKCWAFLGGRQWKRRGALRWSM